MKKRPVVVRASRVRIAMRGVRDDLGRRILSICSRAPGIIATAAVAMTVRGHSALTRDAVGAELLGHAEHAHAHAVLRHRVGDVVAEPFRVEVERRRQREDVRIASAAADVLRCGRHACEQANVPRTLTPNMRSKRFIGVAAVPVRLIALALLTRMSMPPNALDRRLDRRRDRASSRMSQAIGSACAAAPASIAAAAVWIVPGSFGCGSTVFAAMATLAPSRAARSAIARPMPREPPVMNSVLPSCMTHGSSLPPNCGGRFARKARDALDEIGRARAGARSSPPRRRAAPTACAPAIRGPGASRCAARAPARSRATSTMASRRGVELGRAARPG